MIAESRTRAFLASIVPVIVNTVLNEHQLVLDIVAFVQKGDFPRSRLGEKQRGKILASWVSRKMQTIAQFSIRDPDAEGSVGTVVPEDALAHRSSLQANPATPPAYKSSSGSLKRTPGTAGSSLRHVESISQIPLAEEPLEDMVLDTPPRKTSDSYFMPPPPGFDGGYADERDSRSDATPTNERPRPLHVSTSLHPGLNTTLDYSPVEHNLYESPDRSRGYVAEPLFEMIYPSPLQEQVYAPNGPAPTYLEYSPVSPIEVPGGVSGRLRIANPTDESSDDWSQDAMRHLNLGR